MQNWLGLYLCKTTPLIIGSTSYWQNFHALLWSQKKLILNQMFWHSSYSHYPPISPPIAPIMWSWWLRFHLAAAGLVPSFGGNLALLDLFRITSITLNSKSPNHAFEWPSLISPSQNSTSLSHFLFQPELAIHLLRLVSVILGRRRHHNTTPTYP